MVKDSTLIKLLVLLGFAFNFIWGFMFQEFSSTTLGTVLGLVLITIYFIFGILRWENLEKEAGK